MTSSSRALAGRGGWDRTPGAEILGHCVPGPVGGGEQSWIRLPEQPGLVPAHPGLPARVKDPGLQQLPCLGDGRCGERGCEVLLLCGLSLPTTHQVFACLLSAGSSGILLRLSPLSHAEPGQALWELFVCCAQGSVVVAQFEDG